MNCRLVMQAKQWEKHNETCPNCHKDTGNTSRFSGLTSFIHPKDSWVAKYTDSRKYIEGIYAVHVVDSLAEDED